MNEPDGSRPATSLVPLPEGLAPERTPYTLLAPFGVTPDSTMGEIHRCGLEAQRARALTAEIRQAWRLLRDPRRRLSLDLLHLPANWCRPGDEAAGEPAPEVPEPPAVTPDLWQLLDDVHPAAAEAEPSELPPPSTFLEDPA